MVSRLRRVAYIAYALVLAICVTALCGWVANVPRLRDFGADFPSMAPAAAIGLALIAASFFSAQRGGRRRAFDARLAAGAAILYSGITLVGYAMGRPIGMDFAFLALRSAEQPQPMSVAVCLTLTLLALAAPLASDPKVFGASANALAALVAASVAFFALLGLSLRLLRFDLATPLLGFSLPTALGTLLAAAGLAFGRPGPWLLDALAGRRTAAVMTRWLLPAAFVVPLAVGWMRLVAERRGVFSEAFGMALFTVVMIASFSALVLWVAHTIDRVSAQREQAEELVGEQRKWLQVTLASIGDGVIATDAGGRVQFLNPAARRLTGWRAADAAGRPISELLDTYDELDGSPLEAPLHEALRLRVAAAAQGEPALRSRDGTSRSVDINAAPILDAANGLLGAVVVLRDASARRQAERSMREAYAELDGRVIRRTAALERASAALRERNALLNAVTAGTPDLICAKDLEGRTLMSNPAWLQAVGRPADGEPPGLDEHDRAVLAAGEPMTIEEAFPGPEGVRTYLTTKSPLRDDQGRAIGVIAVAHDITERMQAQRELEKLVVAEQGLRADAERANRAKDEFLAIVSHELRSPLNALRGWSHLLAATRPLEASLVERASKAIKRNVDHQTRLIDDLLDTSRIVSGKLNIERRVVDMVEPVQGAIEAVRPSSLAKQVEVRFDFERAAPATVVGDPGRLQQVATNLLSNAVKFAPEHGHVEVRLERGGERVRLVVRDDGIGIAPEFLPHIFDRFSQADTTSARRHGGLGIGLALVRHIAKLHGGEVRAESPGLGKGSTFTLELPAAPSGAVLVPLAERRRGTETPLAGMRVWIVDDDADAHEVVGLVLRQAGAAVSSFSSGQALVEALAAAADDAWPAVLLVDLAMPEQDGFETLQRIRALEALRPGREPVPAVALTAFTQVERERLAASGFSDRADKPVDADKLVATIRAAADGQRPALARAV